MQGDLPPASPPKRRWPFGYEAPHDPKPEPDETPVQRF